MKEKRYEGSELRRVLAGMVTDQVTCARIASQWNADGLFDVPYANLVGNWCVKYLQEYGEPPNTQLKSIFERWANGKDIDKATLSGVERLLKYLSDEWSKSGPINSDYLLSIAGDLFNRVKVRKALLESEELLESNQAGEALQRMSSLNKVELGSGSMIEPAEDFLAWQTAFDPFRKRPLVQYSGGLEKFFRGAMVRNSLIGFMAPDKSGKTYMLVDVGYRGIRCRCNVVHFQTGDLSQDEVLERYGQRSARLPLLSQTVPYPLALLDKGEVEKEERVLPGLTDVEGFQAVKRLCRGRRNFRLSCFPAGTISVDGIYTILQNWARDGWVADIVVIDYADVLAPPKGIKDSLEQHDETWKRLHKISHQLHCLVVTASQSNSAAYNNGQGVLTKKNFSGRKTKLAYVNGMVGINNTDEDKAKGSFRLNWIVRRNAAYRENQCCLVAGCLDIGCPTILSHF